MIIPYKSIAQQAIDSTKQIDSNHYTSKDIAAEFAASRNSAFSHYAGLQQQNYGERVFAMPVQEKKPNSDYQNSGLQRDIMNILNYNSAAVNQIRNPKDNLYQN